jgi:hypothetical protein
VSRPRGKEAGNLPHPKPICRSRAFSVGPCEQSPHGLALFVPIQNETYLSLAWTSCISLVGDIVSAHGGEGMQVESSLPLPYPVVPARKRSPAS